MMNAKTIDRLEVDDAFVAGTRHHAVVRFMALMGDGRWRRVVRFLGNEAAPHGQSAPGLTISAPQFARNRGPQSGKTTSDPVLVKRLMAATDELGAGGLAAGAFVAALAKDLAKLVERDHERRQRHVIACGFGVAPLLRDLLAEGTDHALASCHGGAPAGAIAQARQELRRAWDQERRAGDQVEATLAAVDQADQFMAGLGLGLNGSLAATRALLMTMTDPDGDLRLFVVERLQGGPVVVQARDSQHARSLVTGDRAAWVMI